MNLLNGIEDLIDRDWCITGYGERIHIVSKVLRLRFPDAPEPRLWATTVCGQWVYDHADAPVHNTLDLPCEHCVRVTRKNEERVHTAAILSS